MNRRDIELLISARETTGRSFSQVTSNIDALNDKIGEQIKTAERGELSLADLRKTQQELAQAGRDLSGLQGQIDAYQKIAANQEKSSEAARSAVNDWLALSAEIDKNGKATAAQTRRLENLEKRLQTTSAALEKNHVDLKEQAAVLARAGVSTDQLETAQTNLVNAARNVGAGLSQVGTAIDGYAVNIARVRDAEQQLAQQQGFERKIEEARRLGDASRFVNLFAQAIDTAKAADNQLTALTGFRAVGAMASEAANDLSRFVQAGEALPITSRAVAAGLRAIIDPGGAALATLDGVETAIREADVAAAEGVKNVNILNTAYNNLSAASASLVQQGALIDTFQRQANAVALARTQFEQAQADVVSLGQAMAQAETPTEQLANELAQAEARLESTGRALGQEEARLGTLSRELRNAGINTAELTRETARLEGAATTAGAAMQRIATATGRGGAKTNGIFGLKPQDLTNVGYQLNDIFVSLASGQKPLTVFIQQGAQLAQIPGFLSGVAGAIARFFPLIAVLTTLGVVVGSVVAKGAQVQEFTKALEQMNVATNGLTGQGLSDISDRLQQLGVDAKDAKTAILDLAQEGLDASTIADYTEAAAQAAQVIGIDFNDAVEAQKAVLTGSIDAVYELTETTHTLTDADLDHVEALFKDGRAAEAREYALRKNKETLDRMAHNSQSIWTPAIQNLGTAWSNFAGWLLSKVQPAIAKINQIMSDAAIGVTFLTGLLAGKSYQQAGRDAVGITVRRPVQPAASAQSIRDRRFLGDAEQEYQVERQLTAQERLRRAEIEARQKAQAAGASATATQQAVQMARAKEQAALDKEGEAAANRSRAASNRAARASAAAARAAEVEANKRRAAQQELENQLRQLNRAAFTGESASLDERLAAIDEKYESIYDSLKKMRALGLTESADGQSLTQIEAQVEAVKERLKTEERIKFFQDQTALLQKQRDAEVAKIVDAQTRGALGVRDAIAQTTEIQQRLSPQIVAAAQSALDIARGLAGATPSPEMVSWIASLERIVAGESTGDVVGGVLLQGFEETQGRLDTLLRERDDLVESYRTLGEIGLKSDAEVRALTAGAYTAQATAIEPVLARLREQIELLHNTKSELTGLPLLTDSAYAAWLAKLQAVEAGLQNVDARFVQVNAAAEQAIQTGIGGAFDTAANSIVGLIGGTKSFGNVLSDVFTTALEFVGSFANAIAQVLIQMVALQAAKTLIGGSTGGFGALFFHGGGIVGQGGSRRSRTGGTGSWIGAPKFHGGGGLGLRPDEYKAVLKRGEEVLTEDNPRHISNVNGSEGGGASPSLKQVLYLDPDEVASAMQGRAGTKTFLTMIRSNKETIKQVLK